MLTDEDFQEADWNGRKVSFRLAKPQDREQLENLSRLTPMDGSMALYFDRSPDFFAMCQIQGDDYQVVVAEIDDVIVGCSAVSYRQQISNGEIKQTAHASDLRVHPDYRLRSMAMEFSKLYTKILNLPHIAFGSCEILDQNVASFKSLQKLPANIETVAASQVDVYQIVPIIPYPISSRYRYRKGGSEDRPIILSFLNHIKNQYDAVPNFNEDLLDRYLSHPGFSYDNFYFVEKNGQTVGMIAVWDQSQVRRLVVLRYSKVANVVIKVVRVLAPIIGLPKPPRFGESLNYLYLRFSSCLPGSEDALKFLKRYVVNQTRKQRKYTFVWDSVPKGDPLASSLNGMARLRSKAWLMRSTAHNELPDAKKPHYVDFSLC